MASGGFVRGFEVWLNSVGGSGSGGRKTVPGLIEATPRSLVFNAGSAFHNPLLPQRRRPTLPQFPNYTLESAADPQRALAKYE